MKENSSNIDPSDKENLLHSNAVLSIKNETDRKKGRPPSYQHSRIYDFNSIDCSIDKKFTFTDFFTLYGASAKFSDGKSITDREDLKSFYKYWLKHRQYKRSLLKAKTKAVCKPTGVVCGKRLSFQAGPFVKACLVENSSGEIAELVKQYQETLKECNKYKDIF